MNSFELNKIFGAILGALVFVMGVGFLAEAIYAPIENRGAGYALPEPELGELGGEAVPEDVVPLSILLANADPAAGEGVMRRCQSCHDFSPANANRAGPGIYDIVGKPIAVHDDFAYSNILIQYREEGEIWDWENLDHFLASPRDFAPGTNMTFAGLRNPEERANLIAFMRTLSDDPEPLPEPEELPTDEPATEEDIAPGDEVDILDPEPVEPEAGATDDAPVVETPAPDADPAPQPLSETPGAGQSPGDPAAPEGASGLDQAPGTAVDADTTGN